MEILYTSAYCYDSLCLFHSFARRGETEQSIVRQSYAGNTKSDETYETEGLS